MSEENVIHDLEILRHGGAEAVVLFIDVARRCFEAGGAPSMNDWIIIAAPALPEADRNSTILLLLRALFGDYDMIAAAEEEHPTIQ